MKSFFEKLNLSKILKYTVYLFLSLMVQNMILGQIRIFGVCALFLPALCVAAGMFEGATWGAVFSLFLGIFADMSFVENLIFFTLLFPALAFASGFVSQFFMNRRFFAFMGISIAALAITAFMQILKTSALDEWSSSMIVTGVLQTLFSLPLAAVAYLPPARWMNKLRIG